MTQGRSLPLPAAGLAVLLALTACGGSQSSGPTDTSPIKVGVITSLTGPFTTLGTANKAGIDIAVEQVNSSGGVNGRKIEVAYEDDQTNPTQAVVAFNKLSGEKLTALLGPVFSDSVLAIKQGPLDSKKIPEIALGASDQIVDPVDKYLFMTPARASVAADRMVQYFKSQSITKLAVWYASDNAFATTGYQATKAQASRSGISLAQEEPFSSRDTKDFSALFTKLDASGAQALFVWVTGAPATIITKAYKNLGLTMPLFFSHAEATPLYFGASATGPASEGVTIASQLGPMGPALPDNVPSKKLALELASKYQASTGGYPPQFAFDGYIGVQLLVDAIKRKGSKPSEIIAGLESNSVLTPQGLYRMTKTDHSGITVDYIQVGVVRNNTLVPTDYSMQLLAKLK
jgi:branched-chain amino acid transport system substrate-binding protein